ncbi:MAG: PEGA domain-containing protein, partial [Patescibacteria group bacterium]|nr:PEGA domain-containing protein [Patescibacteria group bacterium]
MRRKFLIIGIVFSLFIGVFFIGRHIFVSRSVGEGKLKVTSNVSARVFLNNKDIGKTPLEKRMPTGEYSLRLVPDSATGLSSWQDNNIKIGKNVLTYVNRELTESELTSSGETLWLEQLKIQRGELTVLSVPDGARVFLNDESKGITPLTLTDLSDGDYNLRVSSPGFESRSIRIKITSG